MGERARKSSHPGVRRAILTVDPASFANPSALFPNWNSVPELAPHYPSSPFIPAQVTSAGYSGDLHAAPPAGLGLGTAHFNCSIDSEENDYKHSTHNVMFGVFRSSCDFTAGASGGPVVQFVAGEPRIIAINGGGVPEYSRVTGTAASRFAPVNPAGLALSVDKYNRRRAWATDLDFNRRVSSRTESMKRVWNVWENFAGGPSDTPYRKLAATRLADGRQWLFAATASGRVWSRWETTPGVAWSSWTQFFAGDSQTTNIVDVAVNYAGASTIEVFLMRADGTIYSRRKTGAWDSAWSGWTTLSASQPTVAITATNTQGYQVLYAATTTNVLVRWKTSTTGNDWTAWSSLALGRASSIIGSCCGPLLGRAGGQRARLRQRDDLPSHGTAGVEELLRTPPCG